MLVYDLRFDLIANHIALSLFVTLKMFSCFFSMKFPPGSPVLPAKKIKRLLDLANEYFYTTGWNDINYSELDSIESIEQSLGSCCFKDGEYSKTVWVIESFEKDRPLRIVSCFRGDEYDENEFCFDSSYRHVYPDKELLVRAIEMTGPCHAFVGNVNSIKSENDALKSLDFSFRRLKNPSGVVLKRLFKFHYLGSSFISQLGGFEYVANTPGAKILRIADGLLLEFISDFSVSLEQGKERELIEAMKYLNLVEPIGD